MSKTWNIDLLNFINVTLPFFSGWYGHSEEEDY